MPKSSNKRVNQSLFNDSLPLELQLKVLEYLDLKNNHKASRVSKHWNMLANDNVLWLHLYEKKFGISNDEKNAIRILNLSFKDAFKLQSKYKEQLDEIEYLVKHCYLEDSDYKDHNNLKKQIHFANFLDLSKSVRTARNKVDQSFIRNYDLIKSLNNFLFLKSITTCLLDRLNPNGQTLKLQNLTLLNNDFFNIRELGSLKKIKHLIIENCHINKLPSIIYQFEELESIKIINTPIDEISSEITILKKLTKLHLNNTKIEEENLKKSLFLSYKQNDPKEEYKTNKPEFVKPKIFIKRARPL